MRAALAVLAVVPVVAGCAEARALPCRDLPGTAVRILPSPHIAYAGTSHAPYSSSPPTSGPHVPFTVAPGVYREPLARELQVHALEHGHVLVQYPVEIAGAGRRDVEDTARRHVRDVIVDRPLVQGIQDGDLVKLESSNGSMEIKAQVRDSIQTGSVFVPFLFDGGAVTALLSQQHDGQMPGVRVRVAVTA